MTAGVRWLTVPPGSGFGNAGSAYITGLRRAGIPVTWSPLSWNSTPWQSAFGRVRADDVDLSDATHADLVDRPICHDSVVVCATPFWHDSLRAEADDRRLVAYTAWETDRLPDSLIERLSHYDLVLVPSSFNAAVFTNSALEVPVAAVAHCLDGDLPTLGGEAAQTDRFVFYTIGPWTARKALADTVDAFVTAFSDADPVELVIYTSWDDLIARRAVEDDARPRSAQPVASWHTLARCLAGRRHVPRIRLDTRTRTNAQVAALHQKGHCFVGLSRGEGWGLGAFEAGAAGNPIVVTGWGGWLDFLPPGYPFRAEFDLVPTLSDPPDLWWSPVAGERWAKVRIEHGAHLLRSVFENRNEAASWGRQLRAHISAHYSIDEVTGQLLCALEHPV